MENPTDQVFNIDSNTKEARRNPHDIELEERQHKLQMVTLPLRRKPFHEGEFIDIFNDGAVKKKKTFTKEEISEFKLRRRIDTPVIRFSVEQILGDKPTDDMDEDEVLNLEMQHMLAAAITKILDQNSAKEVFDSDMSVLIIKELDGQAHDPQSDHRKSLKF